MQVSAVVHWWGSEGNSNADIIITNDFRICETHYLLKHAAAPVTTTTAPTTTAGALPDVNAPLSHYSPGPNRLPQKALV